MNKTITYIKRNNIDVERYNACISNAKNNRIYAYAWYLDIVTDTWDVLVLGDYDVVMPLPYLHVKKLFFRKRIVQPIYCQQLGVFYSDDISHDLFDLFYKKFKTLNPLIYSFNSDNSRYISSLKEKPNYELDINKPYDDIYRNYSNNLKRNLKKAKKYELGITNKIGVAEYIYLKSANKKHRITKKNFITIKKLSQEIKRQNFGSFKAVVFNDEVLAIGFFTKSKNRIIHLLSVSTSKGKQMGATSILFDYIISTNIESDNIIDFEGSIIPGVARFFKSFGASNNGYPLFNK